MAADEQYIDQLVEDKLKLLSERGYLDRPAEGSISATEFRNLLKDEVYGALTLMVIKPGPKTFILDVSCEYNTGHKAEIALQFLFNESKKCLEIDAIQIKMENKRHSFELLTSADLPPLNAIPELLESVELLRKIRTSPRFLDDSGKNPGKNLN